MSPTFARLLTSCLLLSFGTCTLVSQTPVTTGQISTLAGKLINWQTPMPLDIREGEPAVNSAIGPPTVLPVDADGTVYFAISPLCSVAKGDPSGVPTRVSGQLPSPDGRNDGCGFSGDTGPATAASPNQVAGLAVDRVSPKQRLIANYGNLPLSFEANGGQSDRQITFISRGLGFSLLLNKQGEAQLVFREKSVQANSMQSGLRMKFLGAAPAPTVEAMDRLPGTVNYFVGNQSHSNVPTYEKVKYSGVYPGVDLVYYGNGGRLEHDFVVAPGADPAEISFRVDGATKLSLNAGGDLLLRTNAGEVQLQKPILYQEVDGARRTIPGGYVLEGIQVSFKVGAYDRNKPLIIDPVLVYSSYFGGNGYDQAFGVAVDGAGSAYITGFASSTNLATAGAYSTAGNGQASAYITKLNPQGTRAVYTTYLGGTTGPDEARAVAIDANGSAYVTGEACSADFPVSSSAFQRQGAGGCDAFVAKMSPDGSSLLYSTLLGGTDNDNGYAIAIDGTGNAYVTGGTCSAAIKYGESQIPYPTTPGAFQQESGGCTDAFITKVNSDGSGLVYSTYLGGSGSYEQGYGIAVDAQGSAYVTGEACSDNFPVTPGAFQTTATPACSAFVTKFNAAGTALIYSTLLGGSDNEVAWGLPWIRKVMLT